jgi:recombination protein RecA
MTALKSRAATVKALEASRDKKRSKWGDKAISLGNQRYVQNVVPSPSLMLDYKMGIGGLPYGYAVEVFGANSLGKTSAIAYPTIANVQKQGKLPALIAAEPAFDLDWATKLGVDPELLMIYRPDNADEAFEMLHDAVYEGLVDYIVFDSIGALAAASEAQEDGKKKAFGISGIVTSGLNAIMPRLWKNNQGLLLLNQQRQDTKSKSTPGMMNYESPGGEALHHNCAIRIQLKPGKVRYTATIEGEEVLCGRELVCQFKKNKLASNSRAGRFDFYYVSDEKFDGKLGVDRIEDVGRTGKVTGVIEGSAWLTHRTFPDGKLHGKPALAKFLHEHPEAYDAIREDIIKKMQTEQLAAAEQPKAKVSKTKPLVDDESLNPDGVLLPNLLKGDS